MSDSDDSKEQTHSSVLPRSANSRLPPGFLFAGRYQIDELLGEGATGSVYAARRLIDDKSLALKVIHPHLLSDRQINKRFHREAAILSHLKGEHIVGVHDFGEEASGRLFMALDRVPGEPLDELIRRRDLPIPAVVDIMLGICAALDEAHTQGVIHRDLKSSNVIVQVDGSVVQHVRVLDFGMSKVLHGESLGSTNLTEQNMVLGTPEYMAPEQARGDDIDERCDVYSAGVILYELLAGSLPFVRRTPVAIMTAHLTEPPPPLSTRASGDSVPRSLAAVVSHALAKARRDRYPSARVLAEAIQTAANLPNDTASVRPPPPARDSLAFRKTDEFGLAHADTMASPPLSKSLSRSRGVPVPVWLIVSIAAGILGAVIGVICALKC